MIGKLYTKNFFKTLLAGWGIGFLASIFGLILSYYFDLPTAPLIVASLSLGFFSPFGRKNPEGAPCPSGGLRLRREEGRGKKDSIQKQAEVSMKSLFGSLSFGARFWDGFVDAWLCFLLFPRRKIGPQSRS